MKKLLSAALATAAAVTMSVAVAAPAHAYPETTLCNNEVGDQWVPITIFSPRGGVGVDPDEEVSYYFCIRTGLTGDTYQLVLLDKDGSRLMICAIYSNDGIDNDLCVNAGS